MRHLKKAIPILLVVVLVFSMIPMKAEATTVSNSTATNYYINQDFDEDKSNIILLPGGENNIAARETDVNGNGFIKLSKHESGMPQMIWDYGNLIQKSNQVVYSFDITLDGNANIDTRIGIHTGGSNSVTNSRLIWFEYAYTPNDGVQRAYLRGYFDKNGVNAGNGSAAIYNFATLLANTSIHVDLALNVAADTYSIWVDGVQKGRNIAYYGSMAIAGAFCVQVARAGGTACIDNLRVYEGTEPTNSAATGPSGGTTVSKVKEEIGDIQLGPYALKGATIDILGYEIPLIDLEAKITLNVGKNIKIVADSGKTVQVLIGFDEDAKANIDGANNSTKYWSESYREVKDMYTQITGKQVDTTRLWNKFSSLRGKLKRDNANMVVGVDASLAGYIEFKYENGGLVFSEGGLIAEFDAKMSLRSYYGPAYLTLGLEMGADGTLVFKDTGNGVNPQVTVSPEFTIAAGGGVGTRSTYVEIDAYGTLSANISTASDVPFEAGLDLGARWMGYLFGKEVFSGKATFAAMELYPNFGDPWGVSLMSLTPEVDVSSVEVYNELINAAEPISRDYLAKPYSLRSLSSFRGASFVKQNAYPLNKPNLVCFDNGTMLLVWIDDTGEKTSENMCSIMYAYYDGTNWSDPAVLFEDGTANDMPCVYSDGRYAYIVWQKASRVFESGVETTDMLPYFDLYAMVFDQSTQTFTEPICVNADENTAFEFEPAIYGENGTFTVAWLENSDNNIYQMSGENTLCASSFDADGELLEEKEILTTTNMFTGLEIGQDCVYYSIQENESNNLYAHNSEPMLLAEAISAFDYCNGLLFYSNTTGFNAYDGSSYTSYGNIGVIDDFKVAYGNGRYALFASVLNEDFSKDLYYSLGENETWSNFEVYSSNGKYIRDYSPVVLSDGAVRVAFNYVEEDMQSATIVVNQCTDDADIVVEYVDFEDESLGTGSVDLQIGIKNNSSTAMESFAISILDSEGNEICTQEATGILPAFGEYELVIGYTLPDDYNGEVYSIQVLPADYFDLDETNNTVNTTFECIHDYSGVWLTTVVPAKGEDGAQVLKCTKCSEVLEERVLPGGTFEKLTRTLSLTDVIYINQYVGITGFDGIDLTSKGGMISWVGTELSAEEAVIENAIVTNLQGLKYDSAKSRFGQQSTGIYSNQYGKTVYMRFYVEIADGLYAYSDIYTDSVVSYCDTVLQKSSNVKQKNTCAALLYYGAAAEVYFDKKTEGLVSDYVPEGYEFTYDESLIDAVKETPATTLPVNDSLVSKFGHTLSLVEAIRINYNAPAAQTAKARLLLWYEGAESLDADNYDYDIEMTWDSDKNRYSAQSDLVFSVSMGNTIYACVEFTDAAGNVTYSGIDVYSAENYAETVINNSSNAAMVDLCKKMVIYGEMAKILFAS